MTQTPEIADQTPLMRQYGELKAQAQDALLLFRMGDFYELFGEDAIEASKILEITLTSRDRNKPNPVPMAGVPHHSAQSYIQRLLKAGKKVAIGEQMEDPSALKPGTKIVRREIVRLFAPGVQFDLEGTDANYLSVAIPVQGSGDSREAWQLACLDASTGEALVSDPILASTLAEELSRIPSRHLLRLGGALPEEALAALHSGGKTLIEDLPQNYLSLAQASDVLKRHYDLGHLETLVGRDSAVLALGILVTYVLRTQKQEMLAHLSLPLPLHEPKSLVLGPSTASHLDLVSSAQSSGPTLYELINRTRSALGARQLKRWLLSPLKDSREIALRQSAVRELSQARPLREKLGTLLAEVYDLERIAARVTARLANPRDTLALGRSLAGLGAFAELLSKSGAAPLSGLGDSFARLGAELGMLSDEITRCQREDAPLVSRDGGIFSPGTNPDLDRLLSLNENGQRWLIELETRERETTGIPSLKVRYNRVFGYYIEVTQAHLKNVPSHYQRKQTTVGAERFFTEELKKFEDEIINASVRQKSLEQELFEALLEKIGQKIQPVMETARALASLDGLVSLSQLSDEPGWVFPEIDESLALEIHAGRHPMVDAAMRGGFVPNDLSLSPETRNVLMITGPNMGGKSTVMRQTALIVLLGQMGAPVPATRARWGAVSSIYTRIGAQDAIARGQSTFMVEMSELAHILHHAEERSLIVLDEIGRGTSTYDGISVAWATLEWICSRIRARTLFATHYHELTNLSGSLPGLANAHMEVESARSSTSARLRFLYKLAEGPANESFGIHVAKIAGLPRPVIERAWKVLDELEKTSLSGANADTPPGQLSFFETSAAPFPSEREIEETPPNPVDPVIEELAGADVNQMTPVQALNFLARLQEISRSKAAGSS